MRFIIVLDLFIFLFDLSDKKTFHNAESTNYPIYGSMNLARTACACNLLVRL